MESITHTNRSRPQLLTMLEQRLPLPVPFLVVVASIRQSEMENDMVSTTSATVGAITSTIVAFGGLALAVDAHGDFANTDSSAPKHGAAITPRCNSTAHTHLLGSQ
ncbi:hypothetical protein ACH5RR_015524 [Cinchona calisaya]|uniref:Uncharacterized protein n=1 Tax=Cinchona calisaya TaxID=153742 RepID=A0ABD2ZWV2_9GENT